MFWLFQALIAGMAVSTRDAWVKRRFSNLGPYYMAGYPLLYSLPFLCAGFLIIPRPMLDRVFFASFATSLPLEMVATLLYMESIRVSPLSLTVPYLAFTPAFTLLTGWLLLREAPNVAGMAGVLCAVTGSYILNFIPGQMSALAPFRAAFKERGSVLMLVVALLYSLTSALGKKAILHSSPLYFALSYCTSLATGMIVVLWLTGRIRPGVLFRNPLGGLVAGSLFLLEMVCHNFAAAAAKVAYMLAVKRLSIVFSVIYGRALFQEKHLFFRLSGAILMVAGAVIISIWGG